MILSRLGRSFSRSSRSRFETVSSFLVPFLIFSSIIFRFLLFLCIGFHSKGAFLGGCVARSGFSEASLLQSPVFHGDNGGSGFLRSYLTSIEANQALGPNNYQRDWRFLLANSTFRRFFSTESPNKKSRRFKFRSSNVCFFPGSLSFFGISVKLEFSVSLIARS